MAARVGAPHGRGGEGIRGGRHSGVEREIGRVASDGVVPRAHEKWRLVALSVGNTNVSSDRTFFKLGVQDFSRPNVATHAARRAHVTI